MANSNNWGEIYNSTWWGDKAWSANTLFIDSAPPGFGLNLLKASEDMNNTRDWSQFLISVAANSTDEAAPNATDTAEKLTFTDAPQSRIQQQIDLEANTTYTFSVYAKVRTGTKAFRLRNVTLGQAQQFTADTSWGLNPDDGRYSFTFTTGATAITHTLSIQNAASAGTGEVFFWGAMLNEGATAGDYVKTDASVGGSAPTPAYSGFGDSFGGVTAYYSLRQFTEAETLNAIRVRRSSDDTEQDIGFDSNGDLDTTALTTFVNADVDTYTSDFSSTEDLGEFNVTGAAAQSVGGVDDAYKGTLSGGSGVHISQVANILSNNTFNVSFDYYIPSGQSVDGILLRTNQTGDGSYQQSVTDAWTSVEISSWNILTGTNVRFYATDGGSQAVNADGDVFYLKNIVVTQTTADGAVTTWYDQSGNGNNATNATASEQPLIVDGGSVVTENGKAAIDFDGVDDNLQKAFTLTNPVSHFVVAQATNSGNFVIDGYNVVNVNSLYTPSTTLIRLLNGVSMTKAYTIGTQAIFSSISKGTDSLLAVNGSSTTQTLSTNSMDGVTIGAAGTLASGYNLLGTIQEVIIFASDQSANLGTVTTGGGTLIQGNINTYFDIV